MSSGLPEHLTAGGLVLPEIKLLSGLVLNKSRDNDPTSLSAQSVGTADQRQDKDPDKEFQSVDHLTLDACLQAQLVRAERALLCADQLLEAWSVLTQSERDDLLEVACAPNSVATEKVERLGGRCFRVNLANGFDLSTRSAIERAKDLARVRKPRECLIRLPCAPWSSQQDANQMTPNSVRI